MNRLFSKTTVLVAIAAVLFSCKNDDLKDDTLEIDANKECSIIVPDGAPRMFNDEYLHITKDGNEYSLFAITKGFYVNEVLSLMVDINGLDKYKPNEKIKINKIDFGMPASSNSNFFTSDYKGKIYLLEYSESEAKLYFDNLTFTLPDGAYVLDGKLTFSMENE